MRADECQLAGDVVAAMRRCAGALETRAPHRAKGVARAKGALAAWAFLLAALLPEMAHAEETRRERVYLTELALLLEGTRRLIAYSEAHGSEPADPELARFAYPLAERYVEMAGRMLPSPKLSVVHPHLLLVVENLERAVDAAAAAEPVSFQRRMRIAREELANLEAVLKQLKLRLPELPR